MARERLSVGEILEMAEQLERNGAAFYRRAAEGIDDSHIRTLLRDLASWEEEHEKVFARMRAKVTGKKGEGKLLDPEDERSLRLRTMVDGNVFDLKGDPAGLIKGRETIEEVLQMAVRKEKDSAVFYLCLKSVLPDDADPSDIERVIEEEMGHIALLNREMATLHHQLM
jgi:rubrerythrin